MTSARELYAPFRPRSARVVAAVLAVAVLVGFGALALVVTDNAAIRTSTGDRLSILGLALAICWFCYRQATVRAVPDHGGLAVRNLVLSRRVEWTEVVSVRFGEGRPWVQLDLADGDTLAVMGIQRADGVFARGESRRLATLVALHEAPGPDR
jgi:hypothetical protein